MKQNGLSQNPWRSIKPAREDSHAWLFPLPYLTQYFEALYNAYGEIQRGVLCFSNVPLCFSHERQRFPSERGLRGLVSSWTGSLRTVATHHFFPAENKRASFAPLSSIPPDGRCVSPRHTTALVISSLGWGQAAPLFSGEVRINALS